MHSREQIISVVLNSAHLMLGEIAEGESVLQMAEDIADKLLTK